MAEKKEILLSGNEATWHMSMLGAIEGTYVGTFKFRCYLSPIEKIAANREYRELMGEQMLLAPEHEANLAYAITQLKYRVISAPPFWTSNSVAGNIPEYEVIMAVLDASMEAELHFREKKKEDKKKDLDRARAAAEKMLSATPDPEEIPEE